MKQAIRKLARLFFIVVFAVFTAGIITSAILIAGQDRFILPASSAPRYDRPPEGVVPYTLTTEDGERLNLWNIPGPAEASKRAILIFNGNGHTVGSSINIQRLFSSLGVATYTIDYRGTGASSGRPSEAGLYKDAQALYHFVTGEQGFAPQNVGVAGYSFGTGIASYLAHEYTVPVLILIAPYTSIPNVVAERGWVALLRSFVRYQLPTRDYLRATKSKCTIIAHGTDDKVIAVSHSRILAEEHASDPRFHSFIISGANHWDIPERAWNSIRTETMRCFEGQPSEASPAA